MNDTKNLDEERKRRQKLVAVAAVVGVVVVAVAVLLVVKPTQKPKVYRVGILCGLDFFLDIADEFKAEMAELGYIEGENIIYDMQTTNFDPDEEQRILEKFVADEVDLIFTFPTEVALAAKAATQGTDIPVLFASAFIEGIDLVESVREPGGNITGIRSPGVDLAAKDLEILVEIAPQVKRVWIPYLQGYPNIPSQLEALHSTAEILGVTLVEVPATDFADIEADLQARAQADDLGIDALMTIYDPLSTWPDVHEEMIEFAIEHQVPIGNQIAFTIDIDIVRVGRQAAPMADKILKGTPAGTIPVISADTVMIIYYATAQELGMTIPENVLRQADEIIR